MDISKQEQLQQLRQRAIDIARNRDAARVERTRTLLHLRDEAIATIKSAMRGEVDETAFEAAKYVIGSTDERNPESDEGYEVDCQISDLRDELKGA
mgnify:CR=1 FL=1